MKIEPITASSMKTEPKWLWLQRSLIPSPTTTAPQAPENESLCLGRALGSENAVAKYHSEERPNCLQSARPNDLHRLGLPRTGGP